MMSESTQPPVPREMTKEEIRDQWGSVAADWGRWEPYFSSSTWPVKQRLLADLHLQPGMRVLDVGCGIGDPSLQVALAVGQEGSVLGLDLAWEMLEVADVRARALGLDNVEFRVGAVEDLSEPDRSFNAVVAQFTIMFLTDVSDGLRKLRGLLRPGGRIAVSTWAPMDVNPMFSIPRAQFAALADRPKLTHRAPGPMHLSKPGELKHALEDAGFGAVEVTDVKFYNFAKDPREYFELVYALTPPFRQNFDSLTADQQKQVREGLMAAVAEYESAGVRVPAVARVGSGIRPFV
jgi:ubiquinone/menaquinone biosynthesis C-methylase UbiE